MTCPIANQTSIHCDEQEQQSAFEILNQLLETNVSYIGSQTFELFEVTDKIDIELMREAIQSDLIAKNNSASTELYLQTILELM